MEGSTPGEETKLTGREIDMGQVPFNLAQYARESFVTEKLYLTEMKDMYIEIIVKSNPVDQSGASTSQSTPRDRQPRATSHKDIPTGGSSTTLFDTTNYHTTTQIRKNPNRKLRTKLVPETDEDQQYVMEHEERKAQLDEERAELERELAERQQEKDEVTQEWERLQM